MLGAGVVCEHERELVSFNLSDAAVGWAHNSSSVNRSRVQAGDREEVHFGLLRKVIPQEMSGADECVVGGEITPSIRTEEY